MYALETLWSWSRHHIIISSFANHGTSKKWGYCDPLFRFSVEQHLFIFPNPSDISRQVTNVVQVGFESIISLTLKTPQQHNHKRWSSYNFNILLTRYSSILMIENLFVSFLNTLVKTSANYLFRILLLIKKMASIS